MKTIRGRADSFHRLRVGDYHVMYDLIEEGRVLLVLGIVHRSDLERWLRSRQSRSLVLTTQSSRFVQPGSGDRAGLRSRMLQESGRRLVVESTEVEAVIGRLARRDAGTAEDARAAVEWLSRGEEEDAPAVFTRHRLQMFLWYELPHKWLVSTDEHLAVAEALAVFFDQLGPRQPSTRRCVAIPRRRNLCETEARGS